MDTLLTFAAIFGALMVAIGRFLVVQKAREISALWVVALRFLPLAELMFLARYWEEAKKGAFTSLIGMALIMPWGGKMLFDAEQAKAKARPGALRGSLAGVENWGAFPKEEQAIWLQCKKERLKAMNARLLGWYQEIQERRGSLGSDPAEVLAFNAEAAAYHEFSAVIQEEKRVLAKLQEEQTLSPENGS
ncbi:MAG: hypothetical protein EOP84_09130 [Verrucomicrobiaceae bacterium]|nr:MAG: hypothetical protein EOP84_09130 [Verrucomicrobiaceae bacterium]